MSLSKALRALWELTRPMDDYYADEYWRVLCWLFSVPKSIWHEPGWYRWKKDGGRRVIHPAGEELGFAHGILVQWRRREFPPSKNLVNLDSLEVAKLHQFSKYALVFDLKSAYDYVTVEKLRYWIKFYRPDLSEEVLDLLVELLTLGGRTPQGCSATEAFYDLVILQLIEKIEESGRQSGAEFCTWYVDDVCVSAPNFFPTNFCRDRAFALVREHGFEVGRWRIFENEPIIYLGVEIDQGKLYLVEEKYKDYCERLGELSARRDAAWYRPRVDGWLSWAYRVYQDEIPEDLLRLFLTYYQKVHRMPMKLVWLLSRQRMRRMFND